MSAIRDFTGERIGRLIVVGRTYDFIQPSGRKRMQWECLCTCGNTTLVLSDNLRKGHTKSCGCLVVDSCTLVGSTYATHRRSRSREWWAWLSARQRCFNPSSMAYKYYGARGIKVCDRWADSFPAFYADMGRAPEGMTLERLDVNGDYCPDNCVWASRKAQARNRRTTVHVNYRGRVRPLCELAEEHGLERELVYDRFKRQGWSIEKTLNTPKGKQNA